MSELVKLVEVNISKSCLSDKPCTIQLTCEYGINLTSICEIIENYKDTGEIPTIEMKFVADDLNVQEFKTLTDEELEKDLILKLIKGGKICKSERTHTLLQRLLIESGRMAYRNRRGAANYLLINSESVLDICSGDRFTFLKSDNVPKNIAIMFYKGKESYDQGFQVIKNGDNSCIHIFDNVENYYTLINVSSDISG